MRIRLSRFTVAMFVLLLPPVFNCEAAERVMHVHSASGAGAHDKRPHGQSAATEPKVLFQDAIAPTLYELPSGALASWRDYSAMKPPLVLFSAHPLLSPLPAEDLGAITQLLESGSVKDLLRRGMNTAADTLFLSPQTVSVAIQAGLIGELVYVLPTLSSLEEFSLQDFRQRATSAGFLTAGEAEALAIKDGVISGTVRGTPFRCVHPDALPKFDRPVLVHVDLSYFKDLYVNDVKTPVYSLLGKTVESLKGLGCRVHAVTLSYSNQEAMLSLDTRFMISNLGAIVRKPALLREGSPASWGMRAEAMFAATMFADSRAQEMIAKAAESTPDDADAAFALAQQLFSQGKPDEAFKKLDRAVNLDPGYAYAYYELAQSGLGLGEAEKALKLLRKAAGLMPDNPFIRMQLADLLIQAGRGREALAMLSELRRLEWSERYHPGVTERLAEMEAAAKQPPR